IPTGGMSSNRYSFRRSDARKPAGHSDGLQEIDPIRAFLRHIVTAWTIHLAEHGEARLLHGRCVRRRNSRTCDARLRPSRRLTQNTTESVEVITTARGADIAKRGQQSLWDVVAP